LLQAKNDREAVPLARKLDAFNRERQQITSRAMEEIKARCGEELLLRKAIVADGEWPSGIIGLIAGKLAERYCRPTAVIETGSGEILHGSARSRSNFHITDALA